MAKRAKANGKGDEPKSVEVKPSEVRDAITEKKLKALLNAARSTTKEVATLTGTIREKIAYAQEHDHLATGPFALIRRLDRMEPEKLADFMDSFEHYMDISGLDARRQQAQRLEFGPGKDADNEDGDDDNVHHLRAAE
jgi:hypothetical protein